MSGSAPRYRARGAGLTSEARYVYSRPATAPSPASEWATAAFPMRRGPPVRQRQVDHRRHSRGANLVQPAAHSTSTPLLACASKRTAASSANVLSIETRASENDDCFEVPPESPQSPPKSPQSPALLALGRAFSMAQLREAECGFAGCGGDDDPQPGQATCGTSELYRPPTPVVPVTATFAITDWHISIDGALHAPTSVEGTPSVPYRFPHGVRAHSAHNRATAGLVDTSTDGQPIISPVSLGVPVAPLLASLPSPRTASPDAVYHDAAAAASYVRDAVAIDGGNGKLTDHLTRGGDLYGYQHGWPLGGGPIGVALTSLRVPSRHARAATPLRRLGNVGTAYSLDVAKGVARGGDDARRVGAPALVPGWVTRQVSEGERNYACWTAARRDALTPSTSAPVLLRPTPQRMLPTRVKQSHNAMQARRQLPGDAKAQRSAYAGYVQYVPPPLGRALPPRKAASHAGAGWEAAKA